VESRYIYVRGSESVRVPLLATQQYVSVPLFATQQYVRVPLFAIQQYVNVPIFATQQFPSFASGAMRPLCLSIFFSIMMFKTPRKYKEAETLRHKPEGRMFESLEGYWDFSLTSSFRSHYGPGLDSASNRNEYQEYFLGDKCGRCLGLTTIPPSYAN
jgi:hypothetical protein